MSRTFIKSGTKKAEFWADKVIITDEITDQGETEIKKKEIEVPDGYTAVRGDPFSNTVPIGKYDRTGDQEQTIPVVNLSFEALHHSVITYIGKETVQLPDQFFATVDHFTTFTKETSAPENKWDIWIDDRGFNVLYSGIGSKGSVVGYQQAYEKDKNRGVIHDLLNGQHFGFTSWEVIESVKDMFKFKIKASVSEKMGGFTMSVEYIIDKDFNPKSYTESWNMPTK